MFYRLLQYTKSSVKSSNGQIPLLPLLLAIRQYNVRLPPFSLNTSCVYAYTYESPVFSRLTCILRTFSSHHNKETDDGVIRYASAKRYKKLNNAIKLLDTMGAEICHTTIAQALEIAEERNLKLLKVWYNGCGLGMNPLIKYGSKTN